MKNKNFISEINKIKSLMGVSLLNEQPFRMLGKGIMKLAVGNIDVFVREFGDNIRQPLESLLSATDDAVQMRKLKEIESLSPGAAKKLRIEIFKQLPENTRNALSATIEHAKQFDNAAERIKGVNDGIGIFFEGITQAEREFLTDIIRAKDASLDDAFEAMKPKTTQPQAAKQLTRTDKILQGLGLQNRALEDRIRSAIRSYEGKTNDEILKVIRDWENDLIKNPTIKKQLDDILTQQSLRTRWKNLPFLKKLGWVITVPVLGPGALSALAGLGVLWFNNIDSLWGLPIYRNISTAFGTVLDLEDVKSKAPLDIREHIYQNEDGSFYIYVDENLQYPIKYNISDGDYYFIDNEEKVKLKDY
jgi:hypothetical protein